MQLDLQHYQNRHSRKNKIARVLWNMTWLLLARWTPTHGVSFFGKWRILLLKLFGAKLGWHCAVRSSARIWAPWNLMCGDCVAISEDCDIYSVDKITIGDRATISRGAFICSASHDTSSRTMELTYAPIAIGNDAWVAARAIVMPGVTINEGSVVGAGAVVVKDVEPFTIVCGNPAKFVKKREFNSTKE